jgi:hypothetical protein
VCVLNASDDSSGADIFALPALQTPESEAAPSSDHKSDAVSVRRWAPRLSLKSACSRRPRYWAQRLFRFLKSVRELKAIPKDEQALQNHDLYSSWLAR